MKIYLQSLSDNTIQGLKEFSEHPVKYTTEALKDLGKNCWDAGAAAFAGFAVTDAQGEIFGEYKIPIIGASLLASAIGSIGDNKRIIRNIYALLATSCYFVGEILEDISEYLLSKGIDRFSEYSEHEAMTMKTFGAIFGGGVVYEEYIRRKGRKEPENSGIETVEPLKDLVE